MNRWQIAALVFVVLAWGALPLLAGRVLDLRDDPFARLDAPR